MSKISINDVRRYEAYLRLYKANAVRGEMTINLVSFCRNSFLNYDRFRGWLRRDKGLGVRELYQQIADERRRYKSEQRQQRKLEAARRRIARHEEQQKAAAVSVSVVPEHDKADAKDINPPTKYLSCSSSEITAALKDKGIETPKGYAWYALPPETQEIFNLLDGVHWNTDVQQTDAASITPVVSAEVDSAKFDTITIEFPEGVRTTMRWVTVSYVSKLLAAYAARKDAYKADERKVGIA